jgi:hypothetical protein
LRMINRLTRFSFFGPRPAGMGAHCAAPPGRYPARRPGSEGHRILGAEIHTRAS